MEVQAFLRTCPPFDAIDDAALNAVVRQTEIAFFPAGTSILEPSGKSSRFVYVVRVGVVELIDGGRVLDQLGSGELFGHLSALSGSAPTTEVRALEDTICYLIPTAAVEGIFASRTGLAFLSSSLRRRMVNALGTPQDQQTDSFRLRVGELVRRAPITCEPFTTVREAATTMASARVSCLVVPMEGGYGILTDRDLRSRVLASGRTGETEVGDVMTHPAVTLGRDAFASEALSLMLEQGVHHLPIVGENDALVGVVTDTDLMGLERRTPFAIRSEIERASDIGAVVSAVRELPRAVTELVATNADPVDIGHVVGVTVDALTERIVELTLADIDPPPQPWAWISLGSQARHEQALATDQDHAFAFADDSDPAMAEWSAAFAERVTQGIEAAGIPRCRAGVGAHAPSWSRSLDGWMQRFDSWIEEVGGEGAVLTAIAFDFRQVTGPLAVEQALNGVLLKAKDRPPFLHHLAAQAVAVQTPTGFFRDLVVESKGEHAGRFDVKHGGLIAITSMARLLALSVGSVEKQTLSRLRDATAAGALSQGDHDALDESFHLLWQIRLEHQCDQSRRGTAIDDFVDPGDLGPITRRALREAFRSITRVQRTLATEFGVRP